MNIELKRSTYNHIIYGAGICEVNIHGSNYYGMAVKAGETKEIVRVIAARKWLIEHGCPVILAKNILLEALES